MISRLGYAESDPVEGLLILQLANRVAATSHGPGEASPYGGRGRAQPQCCERIVSTGRSRPEPIHEGDGIAGEDPGASEDVRVPGSA